MPEIPENINDLNRDELLALEDQLLARFDELRDSEPSDEVTEEMSRISQALPLIGDRVSALDAAEAANTAAQQAAEQARQRRAAAEQAAEQARLEAEQRAEAERQAAEAAAQAEQDATQTPVQQEQSPEPAAPAHTPVAVTESEPGLAMAANATSGRPSVADIAAKAPAPQAPKEAQRERWHTSLTAGAEINGVSAGARFETSSAVADAVIRRTEALAVSQGVRSAMFARAHLDALPEPVTRKESAATVTTRMLEAIKDFEKRGPNRDVLTADGGWCAPSEVLYDLCEPEVADQLISLPEISITRGGLQYFKSPDFSDFSDALWGFCEDELIDGVEKPCAEIPCPEPEEVRACVEGACITAGILQTKAFPEWTERYVRGMLVAHAIRISAATIAKMEAESTPIVYEETAPMIQGAGFTATLLNTIEFQVEDLRADYFLGVGDRPVVVLPRWAKGIIRADLANRMGVDLLRISDDYINSLFYDRGVGRIQWVKGWQTEVVGAKGVAHAWPCNLRYLLYREGAWVRGLEPVIELETLYDSELLRQNKMTRLFTEQAFLVANLCTDSRVVTIPVCPSGATHCGNPIACFTDSCSTGEGEGEGGEGGGEG